jgi:D-glycero-alpha-D-manno-heptose-7-phosphate kinase
MIVGSCPLRISLFGGSTDSTQFVETFGRGSVISFACDLKTYVSLSQDRFGANNFNHKYVLNYSRREEVNDISEIKNELIRVALQNFNVPPVSIFLTSDVYSHGSGLASSSSYLISLIKAISIFKNLELTDHQICNIAFELERIINPYCGYQDPYGCGIGGFKRMDFYRNGRIQYEFLPTSVFENYDMHLVFTGITRNSKEVLKNVTSNVDKIYPLLETLDLSYQALVGEDHAEFFHLFNKSWSQKKQTSSMILENKELIKIDKELSSHDNIVAHKLCGAGNGGFFLTFSKKNTVPDIDGLVKLSISTNGVKGSRA